MSEVVLQGKAEGELKRKRREGGGGTNKTPDKGRKLIEELN